MDKITKQDNKKNEESFSDDDVTAPVVSVIPSNKDMRYFLNKCSDYYYLCGKENATDEVYRALKTLEEFVDNELFRQKQSKITDFFKK